RASINGFVTRADLQQPPVRMLLFGLVSLLEMYLVAMVRICYPDESFQDSLTPGRQDKARQLLAERTGRNEDIDLADCLKLSDKYNLLVQVPGFLEFFGLGQPRVALKAFKEMEQLRDNLAHGQDLVAGKTWEEVIRTVNNLQAFLTDCHAKGEEFIRKFSKA